MIATSRRRFLQGACAIGAASPLLSACATDAMKSGPFFANNGLPIGIQLYTLADMLRSDLEGTIENVARIGYKTVETPSYMGKTPAQLRASFDKNGLKCTSCHIAMRPGTPEEPGLTGDLSKLAADMHTLGATHAICPAMAAPDDIKLEPVAGEGFRMIVRVVEAMTADHWKRMGDQFNGIGRALKADGIKFGYHNHNFEFVKVGDTTGYELLIANTDPELVTFELDVGWAAAAGRDPVQLFNAHKGRFGAMHVKDLKASTVPNLELKMDPTEIGAGELDWAKIMPAAYAAGVRNYFLEQEPPFVKTRLEAAEIGYNYLSKLEV
jgi:sugar phosphate isomerase/epimerase